MIDKPLPPIKIRYLVEPDKIVTCSIQDCERVIEFNADNLVIINEQIVWSYQELLDIIKQDDCRRKESIEIVVAPNMVDGG